MRMVVNSKPGLPSQFGKGHESPNISGKIAATLLSILVVNHPSVKGFEPVRSDFRIRSGPGVQPTASCYRRLERDEAWRRMSARRSLTLSRFILPPSPSSIGCLGLGLEEVGNNLDSGAVVRAAVPARAALFHFGTTRPDATASAGKFARNISHTTRAPAGTAASPVRHLQSPARLSPLTTRGIYK